MTRLFRVWYFNNQTTLFKQLNIELKYYAHRAHGLQFKHKMLITSIQQIVMVMSYNMCGFYFMYIS